MSQTVGPAIASESRSLYSVPMVCWVIRFLSMFAMLLLPFAMTAAPAAPADLHHASSSMSVGHCPEQPGSDFAPTMTAECAMPCSAALPALEVERLAAAALATVGADPAFQPALAGILLEMDTPPPRPA
jgi:hypothetical protein